MRTLLRSLRDNRDLWRIWLPLLVLAGVLPLVSLGMPLIEKQLIDGVILAQRLKLLSGTLATYGALWLLSTASLLAGATLRAYLDERLMLRLRQALFTHCQTLSVAFAQREHSGRTMALFANDIPIMAGLFSTTITSVVASAVTLIVGVVVMFSLSWQLAIAAGLLPPLVAGLAWVVTRPLRPAARRAQEKAAELTERLQENLAGIREVVAFGRERSQGERFGATLRELLRLRMRVTMMDTGVRTGQLLFSLTVTLVILGYGGYLVIQGHTTLGTVIAMRSLFSLVFQPAGQIAGQVSAAQRALGAADRVYAALDATPRVVEHDGARMPDAVAGEIAFEHVSFGYRPRQTVLRDVSLVARPGEVIALVGPSGAGKSTLVSLIARFYDPGAGRVTLDGVDLRDLPLAGLRAHIGFVFQDSFLFATTIRENIAFGRPGATAAEIEAAARAANAWEFIERLPEGLETQVGERGAQLSEGQKQRLTIARALLRDPGVLILDEPTSALDARSEHLLQSALENLMRGRTTFVIAHRLATVQRADRILVLEGGHIVEQGGHAHLLEQRGLYRELHDLQFASAAHLAETDAPATVGAGQ
ncbi:MAG TPA: ABC transporter ATP-binding protein [Ktedonobacterales bacterium]